MNTTLSPKVLQWARLRAGLSGAVLAGKLGVSEGEVEGWERSGLIEQHLVGKLASATKTPFGYLFLDTPPADKLPVSDFRKVAAVTPSAPSRGLLSVIYQCQRRQQWYREYLVSNGAQNLPFVGKFTTSAHVDTVATDISKTVKLGPDFNRNATGWEDVMRIAIENIEDAGILVNRVGFAENYTHNKLSVKEFRGFALCDPLAPLIFVNGADAPPAQMFTLAHEVVHIWLGESGVSNLEQTYSGTYKTEVFCNQVAAQILVPIQDLESDWNNSAIPKNEIARLAIKYRVSKIVMARRAKDTGRINNSDYNSFYQTEVTAAKATGGNYYITKPYEASRRLSVALIRDARNGKTMFREAMQLLGIKNTSTFQRYAEALHISM